MSILVTGGAGFIGSSLLDRLAQGNDELICWDDFNDYYDPRVKRANIAPLLERKRVTLYEGDICDFEFGKRIFAAHKIKTIVHLAARAGVRPSLKEPLLYEKVNIGGTSVLLELARLNGVEKFVFGSSSSVYGNNSALPFSEEEPAAAPVSPYAATKRSCELMCHCYHEIYKMPIVCLRFFNVYGPRCRPDLAIHIFTRAMLHDKEITVFGDGSIRRDYTFISDILDGVTAAMKVKCGFEIVNLGESGTITVRELINLVAKATRRTPRLRYEAQQLGDVMATFADICKARKLLSYNPSFPIERGIPIFVEWYKQNILAQE